MIRKHTFPSNLKLADITPIFKKLDRVYKKNYRPVSILPTISKVFERILKNQMEEKVDTFLSPFLCGYRKDFCVEYALVYMIEKWKKALDRGGVAGGVLMDLSKAFDTINHELLIAKMEAYGFHKDSLEIMLSYLSGRKQRTKISSEYSSWTDLLKGVPQGSILGPVLFNIYFNDFFYFITNSDICNLADDTTPFFCGSDIDNVIRNLEEDIDASIDWFHRNFMKLNDDKCHFLLAGSKEVNNVLRFGDNFLEESLYEKLLGVTIDKCLKFDIHIRNVCQQAGRKLSALSRLANMLTLRQRRVFFQSFIKSQFQYGSLVWMFCGRESLKSIENIQERALRLSYNDYTTTYDKLLKQSKFDKVHHGHIKKVAIEMYKVWNSISPPIIRDLFRKIESNCTRTGKRFEYPYRKSELKGKFSLRCFGPVVWNEILPPELKDIGNIEDFKVELKNWTPVCTCRLCKDFISGVGYIN